MSPDFWFESASAFWPCAFSPFASLDDDFPHLWTYAVEWCVEAEDFEAARELLRPVSDVPQTRLSPLLAAALPWLHYKFPTLRVDFTIGWMVKATIIAILGSMMGAIYPAFKAAQKDPIDALAYE